MHLIHQNVPGLCWGDPKDPPILKTNTSRQRLNILGAYNQSFQGSTTYLIFDQSNSLIILDKPASMRYSRIGNNCIWR
jgi:hypothetical protein